MTNITATDKMPLPLVDNPHLAALRQEITPLKSVVTNHPVFGVVSSLSDLQVFMERHVFAVYDFMCLLTALQQELTCVCPPWVPKGDRDIRRFINHIVLEEESDEAADGEYGSHLEMYIDAMKETGANTGPIESFLSSLVSGKSLLDALDDANAPVEAAAFTRTTWSFVASGETHKVAAAFTFGREDPIPNMFRSLLKELKKDFPDQFVALVYYLERHIHLDEDFHNPMAQRLVAKLCGDNAQKWEEATATATAALQSRNRLWDQTKEAIEANQSVSSES
jgi:hypothetical protein